MKVYVLQVVFDCESNALKGVFATLAAAEASVPEATWRRVDGGCGDVVSREVTEPYAGGHDVYEFDLQ